MVIPSSGVAPSNSSGTLYGDAVTGMTIDTRLDSGSLWASPVLADGSLSVHGNFGGNSYGR